MEPTSAQLEVLNAQDDQTLAEWWCELNRWRWPDALPDPEPVPQYHSDGQDVRWAVMCWIDAKIGHKIVSRTWNKDMPDEVFESFWRKERDVPDSPYARWSEARVAARMAARREREDAQLASEFILEDILDAEVING